MVFCTDDLAGFSQAILEVYSLAIIQKCIVHKVGSTRFVDDKDSKAVRKDLRTVSGLHPGSGQNRYGCFP
ncbi:MAG: transposase [Saprospirales bacterium]|nr:transposase [Saprospirales bacterium]